MGSNEMSAMGQRAVKEVSSGQGAIIWGSGELAVGQGAVGKTGSGQRDQENRLAVGWGS